MGGLFRKRKATTTALNSHTSDNDIHVTTADKSTRNGKTNQTNQTDFTAHTGNTTMYITGTERTAWNAKAAYGTE